MSDKKTMHQGKMCCFCDDCGRKIHSTEAFIYGNLPCDIASANAGESAVVCRACSEKIEMNADKEQTP